MFVYSAKCKRPNICFTGKGYCCNSCKLGKTCESKGGDWRAVDAKGGDITSSLISKIPYELHLRDTSFKKYSYCGPNTNLEKRLNPDGTPKPGYEPINKVDNICMHHDYNYKLADEGGMTRHEADKVMLDELNNLENKKLNWNEWFAKYFTKGVIGAKYKLGLGIEDTLTAELHKPIRHKFKRRRVFVFTVDDIWSADLMDRHNISKYNKGFKYILTVIDIFSKFAYAIPLKNKNSSTIIDAFEKLFSKTKPRKLWTDQGTEFTNNKFQDFLQKNNIGLYHVYNEGKACVVERLNRTIGELIAKHMTRTNSNNYVNKLQEIIDKYNHTYNRSIGMSPIEATQTENIAKVFRTLYPHTDTKTEKPKFKVGDRVRIYKYKDKFAKGSEQNWTKEIFVVSDIVNSKPITYKIKDLKNEDILGSFYAQELNPTKF